MPSLARREWLLLAALALSIFFAYQPCWQGGPIWDDDAHLTRPELQSWQGLGRIWYDVRATTQYYPLLHSAFWIEHRLWGDAPLGYHLLNLLLHATAALLVALILRRLAIPGALLAAAIFALHPVHVESVAWITEQKNTLSAVFYLATLLVYLHFDRKRTIPLYCGALALFLAAILSKTVTATLPGALLVIFWWQRGRLSWRRDVLPLVPFFLLGASAGMVTAWWELQVNHCVGPEFQFTLPERLLIASRAVCFHLGKLCWPAKLTFIYPRWPMDSAAWWPYLFPAGLALLLAGLWSIRRRTRSPLAALLFFVGTLFPTLGFFNLYTFRYSLVANHYQYLASLGPITLAAAAATILLGSGRRTVILSAAKNLACCSSHEILRYAQDDIRGREKGDSFLVPAQMGTVPFFPRSAGYVLGLALLAGLAGLTWRQSRMYVDHETLYRTTIDENPDCWMAHNNLGLLLAARHQVEPAIAEFQKVLQIRPDDAEGHNNLGLALAGRGQFQEAIAQYRKALEIKPAYAMAENNLGAALADQGRLAEAILHYRKALELNPDYAEAHSNLGAALAGRGKPVEALAHYRQALELAPDSAETHNNLAWLQATCPIAALRDGAQAVTHARRANELRGDAPGVLDTLAAAYAEAGRFPEAVAAARKALVLARQQKNRALAEALPGRIAIYETGKPYRETASIQR